MDRIFRQLVLISRVVIGAIFMAHGYQKLFLAGIPSTITSFEKLGAPAPGITAYYASIVELGAGFLLIIGLLLPLAGILLLIDMLGATIFVWAAHGTLLGQMSFDLAAALGIVSILLGFSGGGPLALDRWIFGRGRRGR
jgi:putative oxidoreductase